MKIIETGIVRITEDKLEMAEFLFDYEGGESGQLAENAVIDWAIERLKSERHDEERSNP